MALVNADDARVAVMDTGDARVVRFGSGAGCDYRLYRDVDGESLARDERPWLACDALRLAGRHNRINALAVWALAEAAGLQPDVIRSGLTAFSGLPHRCETVAEHRGVTWVNDSKGTNLGALMASLEGMSAPVILLAGGIFAFTLVREFFPESRPDKILIAAGHPGQQPGQRLALRHPGSRQPQPE